jgi:type IV pilus assembly protein PilM
MAGTRPLLGPQIAVELTPERVIAARSGKGGGGMEVYASRRLPTGALAGGLTSANILNRDAVAAAVSSALNGVAARTKDVTVIVPDTSVRVLLLDFDSLPENRSEAAQVIRFRVRKSVSFDVDHAALSFESRKTAGGVRVVAALMPGGAREEYESLFRELGYTPGVIVPSTLASLGIVEGGRPTMTLKVDALTTTVAVVDNDELLLLRILEHAPGSEIDTNELVAGVHPSMVFFEDTYSARIEQIYVSGASGGSRIAQELQREMQVSAAELAAPGGMADGGSEQVSAGALTAVAGALAG